MALATRKFGTTCPLCKHFCFLSYVEIEETASVGELRAKLLRQGWLGELARCDDPKCSGETFCAGIRRCSRASCHRLLVC